VCSAQSRVPVKLVKDLSPAAPAQDLTPAEVAQDLTPTKLAQNRFPLSRITDSTINPTATIPSTTEDALVTARVREAEATTPTLVTAALG